MISILLSYYYYDLGYISMLYVGVYFAMVPKRYELTVFVHEELDMT